MIDRDQLRRRVTRPTLQYLGLWSEAAEALLIGTAAQESAGGRYLHQLGGGPALGIYQMEPETHKDIWKNFLTYRADLAPLVRGLRSVQSPGIRAAEEMIGNLFYATAMTRIHYFRRPEALPDAGDIPALAAYWKAHYNTVLGAGTEEEFIAAWSRYI